MANLPRMLGAQGTGRFLTACFADAINRRDPKVGGASVKHHGEALRRCANADDSVVLCLGRITRSAPPLRWWTHDFLWAYCSEQLWASQKQILFHRLYLMYWVKFIPRLKEPLTVLGHQLKIEISVDTWLLKWRAYQHTACNCLSARIWPWKSTLALRDLFIGWSISGIQRHKSFVTVKSIWVCIFKCMLVN